MIGLADIIGLKPIIDPEEGRHLSHEERAELLNRWFSDRGVDPAAITEWGLAQVQDDFHNGVAASSLGLGTIGLCGWVGMAYEHGVRTGMAIAELLRERDQPGD